MSPQSNNLAQGAPSDSPNESVTPQYTVRDILSLMEKTHAKFEVVKCSNSKDDKGSKRRKVIKKKKKKRTLRERLLEKLMYQSLRQKLHEEQFLIRQTRQDMEADQTLMETMGSLSIKSNSNLL